jgi:hypothetical protein
MATFAALYYWSGRCNNQHWTMMPGESRHVETAGFLTDSVQVVSEETPLYHVHMFNPHSSKNATISRGTNVYATASPVCPSLTGKPVILDTSSQKVVLMARAFQYQYFYLNEKSTIGVTVQQLQGATNIMVLRGHKVLARIQDKKLYPSLGDAHHVVSDLQLQFTMDEIIFERFAWTRQRAPIEFSFTAPATDVYVLIYDNAAMDEPAILNVKYHMVLTTYSLEGLVPWCSHSSPVDDDTAVTSFTCPPMEVSRAGCIIVQAVEQQNRTDDAFSHFGEGAVEVTAFVTRNWLYIGVLSFLPATALALILYFRNRSRHRRERRWRERYHRRRHTSSDEQRERPSYQYLAPFQQQEGNDGDLSLIHEDAGNREDAVPMEHQNPDVSDDNPGNLETTTIVRAENVVLVND